MLRKRFSTFMLALALQLTPGAIYPLLAASAGPPQPTAEVEAIHERWMQAHQEARFADSLRLGSEALSKARSLSDRAGEAWALIDIGLTYSAPHQPQQALDTFLQALPLVRALGFQGGEAITLTNIGTAYLDLGQPQNALDYFRPALALNRALQNSSGEITTLRGMAVAQQRLGHPGEGPGPAPAGPQRSSQEVLALLQKGEQAYRAARFSESLRLFEEALVRARPLADRGSEAVALTDMGVTYDKMGQAQKALESLNEALPLRRAVRDQNGEATTLVSLGTVYLEMQQPQRAVQCYSQALTLERAVQDQEGEARTLISMGGVYDQTGQWQAALTCYSQALPLLSTLDDLGGQAAALSSIGNVCAELGQPERALEFYRQSGLRSKALGDKRAEAVNLEGIGWIDHTLGQQQRALELFRQALALFRAVGDRRSEAITLSNTAGVLAKTGHSPQALEDYRQALLLARSMQNQGGEATTLSNIGLLYENTGQPLKALPYFSRALAFQRALRDQRGEALTLGSAAGAEEMLGRTAAAANHLHEALLLLEATRQELAGGRSDARQSYLTSTLGAYHEYVRLLLRQKDPSAAFAWTEKSKARSLIDLMTARPVDFNKELSPDEQRLLQTAQQKVRQLNQELVAEAVKPDPSKARLAALQQRLARADRDQQTVSNVLYARHPSLARQDVAKTVSLTEVARFLPPDTALLDYLALNTRFGPRTMDEALLFCVTSQSGKPRAVAYPIARPLGELAEKIDDFRQACADPSREYRFKAHDLYQLLVAPAAKQLAGKKRLLICPDGPLWGLPFQALIPSGPAGAPPFLAQRFEIDYAYSATAAQAALQASKDPHRPKPSGTLLAFANPDFGSPPAPGHSVPGGQVLASARPIIADARPIIADARGLFVRRDGSITPLPGTEKEAEALKQDFPDATILTGPKALKSTALQEAGKYRYLHFATHGFFNDAAPLMSAVVLAQSPPGADDDQFLTARDFLDLHLSADLVVLSACDTARGEKEAGEGIVGLTWALFVAGAPSQVVSQWSVNDASTAELMGNFYAGLKAGQAKGAALREAGLKLLQDQQQPQYRHPYYWAPFILLGDWR